MKEGVNLSSSLSVVLVVLWLLLALVDMWFDVVTLDVFIKITISLVVVIIMIMMIKLAFRSSE